MSPIEAQVQRARRRITTDRWFNHVCRTTTVAAGMFAAVVLVDRLYAFDWPLGIVAAGLGGLSLIVSVIWAIATRIDTYGAAAALDNAANLRERISSGLYCKESKDPFAGAVVSDAETISRNLTVGQHLRYRFPQAFSGMAVTVVLACGLMLLPAGMLVGEETPDGQDVENIQRTTTIVKKHAQQLKSVARTNPELAKKLDELEASANLPDPNLKKPMDFRRNAIKKLDAIQDVLKEEQKSERFEQAKEFKRMMRGLNPDKSDESETSKLSNSLAKGDFKAALKQLEKLKKQLEENAGEKNQEQLKNLEMQLDKLADQIKKLSENQNLKQDLQKAGLSKEDAEKMMKNMTAQDMQKLKEALQKKGLNQKEVEKQSKQLQSKCKACNQGGALSDALKQAAKAAGAGQAGKGGKGLGDAGQMLSEMEMLEQEMNDIEAGISQLQDSKNQLSDANQKQGNQKCGSCKGSGRQGNKPCGSCNGRGNGGMGPNMQNGRGGIAPEQATLTGFQKHRQKVKNHKGSIIGQFLVDGPQEKGEVSSEVKEVIISAERDAADAVNRKRIPRKYQDAVRKFYSDLQRKAGVTDEDKAAAEESEDGGASDTESDGGDE